MAEGVGAPIHHTQALGDFLAGGRRVEQLPGYAPDLNPVEGGWDYLLRRAIACLRQKLQLICGFIQHDGY